MSFQKALAWSLFWIGLSLLVAIGIYNYAGPDQAEAFVTGYLLEKSLSFDNLFIFLMLFTYFGVSAAAQRRALNYGIIGVLILRGLLIFLGVALVDEFEWLMYAFGVVVLYSGFVMFRGSSEEFDPSTSRTIKLVSRMIKIAPDFHGTRFFVREEFRNRTRLIATPLFLVLAVIEVMDIIFAVDSIPAIFAVTRDPFIIYASNMLAVLGLRSLYFLLVRVHEAFRFVKQGVGVILWFIGIKMLLPAIWPSFQITNTLALAVVTTILLVSVLLSVTVRKKDDGFLK